MSGTAPVLGPPSFLDPAQWPSLGWVQEPTPVQPLPEDAEALGFSWFGLKRDDAIGNLLGGTKIRKLDVLLAHPPWSEAPAWSSVGAIGSGQLTALTAAATALGRRLRAHLFWEVPSTPVLENLSYVASGPTDLRFHGGRVGLAIGAPAVLVARSDGGLPVVPVGATHPLGTLGVAFAMLELAAQVDAGLLPRPDVIVVPLGSGGTVAGLRLGLRALAWRTALWAVATVERPLATGGRVAGVEQGAIRILARRGFVVPRGPAPPLQILHGAVGPGYGVPTAESEAATLWLRARDAQGEPVYSGKALGALLRHHQRLRGQAVLFWCTPRRATLPAPDPGWRDRLPARLRRRLDRWGTPSRALLPRRVVLGAGVGAGALWLATWGRPTPALDGLTLRALSPKEAAIVEAAARAILPLRPGDGLPEGTAWVRIVEHVDRWVHALPKATRREVGALLQLAERGTAAAGMGSTLSRLRPEDAATAIRTLHKGGSLLAVAMRGLRDLLLLARWQEPESWSRIGWPGPWVRGQSRLEAVRTDGLPARPSRYDHLVAPAGALPKAAR